MVATGTILMTVAFPGFFFPEINAKLQKENYGDDAVPMDNGITKA